MEKLVIGQVKIEAQKVGGKLKLGQNYAPFRSVSPRFEANKIETVSSLPPIIIPISAPNQKLHSSKPEAQRNQSQFFFKSRISRFVDQKINCSTLFCSVSGSITKKQISPSKQNCNLARRLLVQSRTIPSIPDCRNKFGYNCQPQRLTLVQKSQKQLERQRSLMKQYKDSLELQKIKFKKQTINELSQTKVQREFIQKAKKMLQKQNLSESTSINHEKGSLKPKYSHLYNWKPEGGQIKFQLPYFIDQYQNKNESRKMKFQFFNSCEKRFKENEMKTSQLGRKANVRVYLQKMINCKDHAR